MSEEVQWMDRSAERTMGSNPPSRRAATPLLLLPLLFLMVVLVAPAMGISRERPVFAASQDEALVLARSEGVEGETVQVTLADLDFKNQDGRTVNFKRDVIGDRVAVLIPFYTTCTIAYPVLVFVFTRLQDLLGERLDKEVVLVSVTVDPATDIPIRLKAYARRQNARPGWVFLTGERNHLARVLLGVRVLPTESLDGHNHAPVTMVGHAQGEWRRFRGFPTPEELLDQIERSLAEKIGHEGRGGHEIPTDPGSSFTGTDMDRRRSFPAGPWRSSASGGPCKGRIVPRSEKQGVLHGSESADP